MKVNLRVSDPNKKLDRLFQDLETIREGKAPAREFVYVTNGDHLSLVIPADDDPDATEA